MLWVDDDEERFVYERTVLGEQGWRIDWAKTVEEAAVRLGAQAYQVVVLDQMVPSAEVGPRSPLIVWAGCRLLWWIRGRSDWERVPGQTGPGPAGAEWACLTSADTPPSINVATPALIVSGIYEPAVFDRTRSASAFDKDVTFLAKPLEPEALIRVAGRKVRTSVPP